MHNFAAPANRIGGATPVLENILTTYNLTTAVTVGNTTLGDLQRNGGVPNQDEYLSPTADGTTNDPKPRDPVQPNPKNDPVRKNPERPVTNPPRDPGR